MLLHTPMQLERKLFVIFVMRFTGLAREVVVGNWESVENESYCMKI